MKRVFGTLEAVLDTLYLALGGVIAFVLLQSGAGNLPRLLMGLAALVLIGGDAFHLIPRIMVIRTGKETSFRRQLGKGKQITSITMTFFYLLIWHIGLAIFSPEGVAFWTYGVYTLALVRIFICLLPQNLWEQRHPPLTWGIWRNIPFFFMGAAVARLYFSYRLALPGFALFWLAVVLSFGFYLPVVLEANKYPKIGMLMLPKTYLYLWLLFMGLSL